MPEMNAKYGGGFLTVLLVIALLYFAQASCGYAFSGHLMQAAVSPDGRFLAQIRQYDWGGATEPRYAGVEIGPRMGGFRHTIFYAGATGETLRISWSTSTTLLVSCDDCGGMELAGSVDRDWHGVAIRYNFAALPQDLAWKFANPSTPNGSSH